MRVAVFSAKSYDRASLEEVNADARHDLRFFDAPLDASTAGLAEGADAACVFVHDRVDADVLERLAGLGVRLVAIRAAGFNNVDLTAAGTLGLTVARVPAYSPHAVAEHAVALMLALNRKIHRAYNRVREGNFALDGLLGFDFAGKTAGVVGTGKIGAVLVRILAGFGCRILAHDPYPSPELEALGVEYVAPDDLFARADVISLHAPLTPQTRHLIDERALGRMKQGVMLVNTSRGALIDTRAVIDALKSGRIGALALDVYEEEDDLFFRDLSEQIIQDDVFTRLLTFPNVLITGHQAYFTREALRGIAETTLANIDAFEQGQRSGNELTPERAPG
ncbi:MAG: 2-hydroxyacid dehydrogenase [Dehalococcoidia bacterium]|nr:2-hydroxyacid dehydrogenase [Dehalococcoidia bacterium]